MARAILYILTVFSSAALWPGPSEAQITPELQRSIDLWVRLCVAGGQQFEVIGGGSGGAEISVRAFDLKGNLQGDFHAKKSQAEGLVNGIDNAMTQVTADEVDKVRDCLKPVRERIIDDLFPAIPSVGPSIIKSVIIDGRTVITDGPLSWEQDLYFSVTCCPTYLAFIISGINNSPSEVQLKDAYLISGLTGSRIDMLVDAGPDGKVLPRETNPFPPGAKFNLWAALSPGLNEKEVLQKWGKIYFVAEYGNIKHNKLFDEDYIKASLMRDPRSQLVPHVSKKN